MHPLFNLSFSERNKLNLNINFQNTTPFLADLSLNTQNKVTIVEIGTGKFNTPQEFDTSSIESYIDTTMITSWTFFSVFIVTDITLFISMITKSKWQQPNPDMDISTDTLIDHAIANNQNHISIFQGCAFAVSMAGTILSAVTGALSILAKKIITTKDGLIGYLKKNIIGDIIESNQNADLLTSQDVFGVTILNPEFTGNKIELDNIDQTAIDQMTLVTEEFLNNNSHAISELIKCLENIEYYPESCNTAKHLLYQKSHDMTGATTESLDNI